MNSDFHSGFGYGAAIGVAAAAAWMIVRPHQDVACLDRTTFRHVRWLIALRWVVARLTGRGVDTQAADAALNALCAWFAAGLRMPKAPSAA